jgi:hypothetical protein
MKPEPVTMSKGLISMQQNEIQALVTSSFTLCGIHDDDVCKYFSLYYITFHGSKVSQNDCRMWNKSYNYKNTYTVQLKHYESTYTHIHTHTHTHI